MQESGRRILDKDYNDTLMALDQFRKLDVHMIYN